jgi:hypothetical protein
MPRAIGSMSRARSVTRVTLRDIGWLNRIDEGFLNAKRDWIHVKSEECDESYFKGYRVAKSD